MSSSSNSPACPTCNRTFESTNRNCGGANRNLKLVPRCYNHKSVRLFCENSSMRGVNKLFKHNSFQLRLIWIIFLISMTILLMYGTLNLILQYCEFGTIINTREEHDETTDFPSITICNHHPFKEEAFELWEKGDIMSPKNFSKTIRESIKKLLIKQKIRDAKRLFASDNLNSYYETIGRLNAMRISHNKSSIIYCLLNLKTDILVGHPAECGIDVTLFPHPQFFNCFIINVNSTYSTQTVSLGLIVHVGKESNFKHLNTSLVQEAYNQAHGIRIVLHEPGTYPDPISEGKNLETGKFTDINFQTQEWKRQDTPKHSCLKKTPTRNYIYHGVSFQYTEDRCTHEEYASAIQENCSCLSAHFPMDDRHKKKTNNYCHKIDFKHLEETSERLECYQRVYDEVIKRKSSQCKSRCNYFIYEAHTSMSHWIPANWQLYWLKRLSHAWAKLSTNESINMMNEFLDESSGEVPSSLVTDPEENVFFVVNRNNFIISAKVETLSVTASALISQIGGLSSLTIGITFATLFEIFEFIYLYRLTKIKRPSSSEMEEENNGDIKQEESQKLN